MLKNTVNQLTRQASSELTKQTTTKLGILGVPFCKGQTKQGVERAPDLLRQIGLMDTLKAVSNGQLEIKDYGNLQYEPDLSNKTQFRNMKNYAEFMGCNRALVAKIQEILKENDQVLTIGGDHAIGFGSVAGSLQHSPDLSLVWIDAHADINLHLTSESGNIHGMPVSFLLQELRTYWKNANLEKFAPNCLTADQLVYIGLRDIDPYEAFLLRKLGIRAYSMDHIDKYGIAKIIEKTLDALNPNNKLHVSFDIDALDSSVAPSTGTVVSGGLTLREGISIVEALRDTNRVQSIDLVELNPLVGTEQDVQTTVVSAMQILKSLCGYKRSGNFANINVDLFSTIK